MAMPILLPSHGKQERPSLLDVHTMGPQKLGVHPGVVRNNTINQGKGNRVISILYIGGSIFLNCPGELYVQVRVRVLIFYV